MALRPKYLLIHRLMTFITLSGRRWKTHGSGKEGSGKEAGSEKASQKGGSKEEIIFLFIKEIFCGFFSPVRRSIWRVNRGLFSGTDTNAQ
jgi:hypothetical protein